MHESVEDAPLRGAKIIIVVLTASLLSLIFGNQAVFATDELTLSISPSAINMSLMPGTFASSSQTISVSTTNTSGYTVTLSTDGSSTALVNQNDNTKTIPTITLPSGSDSISAASFGYGYGYSIDNGANYRPVPDPSGAGTRLFKTTTAGTNQHTLTFGVKVPTNAVAGTYSNTFNIVAVVNLSPCPEESICYAGNGDDETGTMTDQSASSNSSVTLISPNYSLSGYGFVGWSTDQDAATKLANDQAVTILGPNQTITTGDLSSEGMQLYATWVQSAGNLQSWHGCHSMDVGDITALTDTRDSSTYAIAKYADEQCWMMENLRLDFSKSQVTIDSSNTNNPTASFTTAINNHPASTNTFCESNSPGASCVDQILFNTNNTNRSSTASPDTNDDNSSWYSYGNYYNWYTATAGNGNYAFNTSGATVDGDICPAGWHLPSSHGNDTDFVKLDKALNGNGSNQSTAAASERWRRYPLNLIYSGEQKASSSYNRGNSGAYATKSTYNSQRSVNFWLQKTAISFNPNNSFKTRGQTVRCVATYYYSVNGNIHYDSNGGSGTMADELNVDFGSAVAANNAFTKANSEFASWNTKADGTGTTVTEGGSVANAARDMGVTDGETLTLYAIWRFSYVVQYDGNGASAGTMSVTHSNLTDKITLIPPNFSRTGYGFAGWSTDQNAATKLANGQAVTIYGPNEVVTIDNAFLANADSNNRITLYATWLAADTNDTMQTFNATKCSNLSTGDVLALTDIRDSNTYFVAKLADGNCWMAENLRLDPSAVTFTRSNTNLPTPSFITEAQTSGSSNTLCKNDGSACIDQILYNANNINRGLTAGYKENTVNYSWYGYGVMYGWYTATAGNGTYSMESGNVAGDICPAGWRLPTGGTSSSDFITLNNTINGGSTKTDAGLLTFPANFIYSGDFNYNMPGGRSTYGRFWSATPNGTDKAFRLGVATSGATPTGSWNKWDAFAVRCIVKQSNN